MRKYLQKRIMIRALRFDGFNWQHLKKFIQNYGQFNKFLGRVNTIRGCVRVKKMTLY